MSRKRSKSSGPLIVPTSKPRNHLVPGALMRKAGDHRKSNKALRAKEKQAYRRVAQLAGQRTFTPQGVGSNPTAPTIADMCAGL